MLKCSPNPKSWYGSSDLNGCFWAKSVYQVLFKTKNICDVVTANLERVGSLGYKMATWLFVRGKFWTADRLEKRGLPHNDKCVLYNFDVENVHYLFTGLVIITIIWSNILNWENCNKSQWVWTSVVLMIRCFISKFGNQRVLCSVAETTMTLLCCKCFASRLIYLDSRRSLAATCSKASSLNKSVM